MSKKAAVLLSALLFITFAVFTALSEVRFPSQAVGIDTAAEAEESEIMSGRDEPGLTPTELLPGETVDINTADAERLGILPGIGGKLAQAIIDYREANGPFEDPEELMLVPGIGQGRFEAVEDLITVSEKSK